MKRILIFTSIMCLVILTSCNNPKLNDREISLFEDIIGTSINTDELINYIKKIHNYDKFDEYKEIKKCFLYKDVFLVVIESKGYNKNLKIAVAIDCKNDNIIEIRIIDHNETRHYVRDFENKWFTDRFKDKDTKINFTRVFLEAKNRSEVVAITGATKTTDGVIDSINLVNKLYRNYIKKSILLDLHKYEENEKIIIKHKLKNIKEITLNDIKKLKYYNRSINVISTKGTQLHKYKGARLNDILKLIKSEIDYSKVYVVGADGYYSCLTKSEVESENKVFIMYEESKKPLLGINNIINSMKLIVIGDDFGQRYTNYIVKIILD